MPNLTPEEKEELTKKIAESETALQNVVGELKDDREKRRVLAEENETLKKALEDATKVNVNQTPPDIATVVESIVKQTLGQRDASVAQGNKVAAIEKFVTENKEFSAANDVTGKRREALENAIRRFNTDGLSTTEEFLAVISDAARLLGANTVPQTSSEIPSPYSSTTRSSITPNVADDRDLTPEEKKLIERNGWTKERYVALKVKNPEYMQNLVNLIRK